jgi:nucleoside-diphosphate-sugar epimerase
VRREALLAGEPIAADPERCLNMVHAEDAAASVVAALGVAMEVGEVRVFNVCDDEPGPRRLYYERAAEALGAPGPTFVAGGESERGDADRRIGNGALKRELLPVLEYPTTAEGVRASVEAERAGRW